MNQSPTLIPFWLHDPVFRAHPLNAGRAAWWMALPGLEGGRQWYDLMGANPAVLTNGATWKDPTRPGGFTEILFDGTDDNATVTGLASASGDDATVAFWFQLYYYSGIFGVVPFGTNTGGTFVYQISDTQIYVTQVAGLVTLPGAGITFADGLWRRMLMTSTASATALYVDGQLLGTGGAGASLPSGPKDFMLGDWIGAPAADYSLNGRLDDVSLWTRALNATEARADYDLSRAGYPGVLNRIRGFAGGGFAGPEGAADLVCVATVAVARAAASAGSAALTAASSVTCAGVARATGAAALAGVSTLTAAGTTTSVGLANGGFELPVEGFGNSEYNPAGSGWTWVSGAGISGNGSAYTFGVPAPEGVQVALCQGTGNFSQAVLLIAGDYTVTFQSARRVFGTDPDVNVKIDGTSVGSWLMTSTAYSLFTTAPFTVTTGVHTLLFDCPNTGGGDATILVDDVKFVPVVTAVTGSASLACVSSLTCAGAATTSRGAALAGVTTLTCAGAATASRGADLASVTTLMAGAGTTILGAANLASVSTLTCAGVATAIGGGSPGAWASVSTLAIAGEARATGAAALAAVTSISLPRGGASTGSASLAAVSTLTCAGAARAAGAATPASVASLTCSNTETALGSASLACVSTLTCASSAAASGSASLASVATLLSGAGVTLVGNASLACVATLGAAGTATATGSAALAAVATLSVAALAGSEGTLVCVSALACTGVATAARGATLASVASLMAGSGALVLGAATLAGVATLTAGGSAGSAAPAALASLATLTVSSTARSTGGASLVAISALAAESLAVRSGPDPARGTTTRIGPDPTRGTTSRS